MTYFFQAHGITDHRKQKAVLIGPPAYKLLCSLVAPKKPDKKSYYELVAAMEKHHNPEIVQRYRFNGHSRMEGESITTYLTELHLLEEY